MRRVASLFLSGLLLPQQAVAGLYPDLSTANHTCSLVPPVLSCSASAQPGLVDTCCAETFGGLVLSTQFWNTFTGLESEGQVLPKDAWTLHGLWPDFCNGSYTQYCDLSRQFDRVPSPNTTDAGAPIPGYTGPGMRSLMAPFARHDLVAAMDRYWVGGGGYDANEELWAHEFSKHATCYSSFDIECYGPQYVAHAELIDFFDTALRYYARLPTWDWLAARGIVPGNDTAYSLADLQGALTEAFGAVPFVGCSGPRFNETDEEGAAGSADNGYTVVNEVWYYHHVVGRVQNVQGVPVDANSTGGRVTNCATTPGALKYYERTLGSEV